jgi:uncharacterized protein YbjQ (UPF0145 family)
VRTQGFATSNDPYIRKEPILAIFLMGRFSIGPTNLPIMASNAVKAEATKGKEKEPDLLPDTPSCFVDTHGVIVSTMNQLPGHRIVKVLGTVYGITVRSRNWGTEIGAFLKSAVGGEIRYFTNLMYSSRNAAMERLVGECLARGGNAIIAMRFDQGEVGTS